MQIKKLIPVLICAVILLAGCKNEPVFETDPIEALFFDESPSPELETQEPAESADIEAEEEEEEPLHFAFQNKGDYYGKLSVNGARLSDAKGNPVQLRGLSSHGLSWFPEFVNGDSLTQMREEWGLNVFRLAMYTDEYNGYCTGDEENRRELVGLIDYAVRKCADLEMYIIIDWHILSDNNPLTYKDEAIDFFGKMSSKYADMEHVIFEICNEPNGDTSWEDVKSYAGAVIPVIRESSDAVILVGTPTWSQDIHLAANDPITGFDNIIYTLHFYAASHGDFLRDRMVEAVGGGLPVFVSEYGICDASGDGIIDEGEADKWLDIMDLAGVSHVMWSLSNKDESASVIDSFCDKTSDFEFADLSQAGRWLISRVSGGPGSRPGLDEGSGLGMSEIESEKLKVSLKESWESGGNMSYLYSVSVKNPGNSEGKWAVELEFDQTIALKEAWNGIFQLDGSVLKITPEEYNSDISPGGTVGDIGFIVEAGEGLGLSKSSVSVG